MRHLKFLRKFKEFVGGLNFAFAQLSPDGIGNYQPKVLDYYHYIGTKSSPVEGTSEAMYLWRFAPSNPPPWVHRQYFVGEIGWRTREFGSHNQTGLSRNKPVKLFPPEEEFEIINRYQNSRKQMLDPKIVELENLLK